MKILIYIHNIFNLKTVILISFNFVLISFCFVMISGVDRSKAAAAVVVVPLVGTPREDQPRSWSAYRKWRTERNMRMRKTTASCIRRARISGDDWSLRAEERASSKHHCSLFLKVFFSDTFTCPILGPLVPLFWISSDVSSGFQSQSGFCLIIIAEANIMYTTTALFLLWFLFLSLPLVVLVFKKISRENKTAMHNCCRCA